ncbi:SusD/RagB family nutrient-binding outer membrane lipoprotein [Spirosoma fluviale]|uniref:Starch-binding associating with outer membrane n=1 Tax=Spirosoma fluviale TaxID=1597977 RepID=A0A286GJ69_9BACT|nr:SusD/RagB family nutrient-binding outer membrane lipoprotein [Spirosoma fluviale]SOD95587.1 Starch-binding associating with outer membrane [Spirosoma fluviale]
MKKIFFLSFTLSLLTLSGCENKFNETNVNPNDPTSVPAERLLPHGIYSAVSNIIGPSSTVSLGLDAGNGWAQHTARIQYTEIDQFSYTSDLQDLPWRYLYNEALADFQKIYELGKTANNENLQAIGLIMRSWVFANLTDVYGDIPYSEALKGTTSGIVAPKFDAQKDVYAGLVNDLKTASDLISTKTVDKDADILFAGDMTKWKKLANSLSLRLLNRMVGKTGLSIDPKAEMTRILSDPAKYPVMTSNTDVAQLVYLSRPNNNPTSENRRTRDDHRVSATLVDKLVALGDPRLGVYANKAVATGLYKGVPNGLPNSDAGALGFTSTSKIGDFFVQETTPGVIMSYAELNFIKAEAALKGVTAAGDAAKAYEEGIKASMAYYKLTLPADYLTTNALKAGDAGLTQVLEQKWIALFGQGVEAWTEYRRTGVPALVVPKVNYNGGVIPTRLPYPSSEENLNNANFKAALTAMGGANTMQTKLWWAK